jgi:hypothetical protein
MIAKYGEVKDGKVTKLFYKKPNWFINEEKTKKVTDNDLINMGVYPIVRDLESFDSKKEIMAFKPKSELVIDEAGKKITGYYYKVEKSVDSIYNNLKKEIDGIRKSQLVTDIPYRFPNTTYGQLCLDCGTVSDAGATQCSNCESTNLVEDTSYVQVRGEADTRNIHVSATKALTYISKDQGSTTMYFRDRDDVTHSMTAIEMLEFTYHVSDIGQQIYNVSWDHKDNGLKPIYENESLTDTQKIDALLAYDIYANRVIPAEPTFDTDEIKR